MPLKERPKERNNRIRRKKSSRAETASGQKCERYLLQWKCNKWADWEEPCEPWQLRRVVFALLVDKLDGWRAGTLSIRMDRSVHVTRSLWLWIWSPLSEPIGFVPVVVFISSTTTFDSTNNWEVLFIPNFIPLGFHKCFLIQSCVLPNDYLTLKVAVFVFSLKVINFNMIFGPYY